MPFPFEISWREVEKSLRQDAIEASKIKTDNGNTCGMILICLANAIARGISNGGNYK